MELGSSVSFKDRRWWQYVDGCHGVDEDRRWKFEIRPWEIQRLERGCRLEMGIERATNLKKWKRERERDYVKVVERNYKKIEEK